MWSSAVVSGKDADGSLIEELKRTELVLVGNAGATCPVSPGMRVRLSAAGWLSTRRRRLAALAVVLSLTACAAGVVRWAAATGPGCAAWAEEVSLTGQVSWQVLLGQGPSENLGSEEAEPLAVGGVAVFAQDGVVHGLQLASGQSLWAYADGLRGVYGMWRWQGLVVVLTVSGGGPIAIPADDWLVRLTGLDAATGAVRWTLPLSHVGPPAGAAATADGSVVVAEGLGQLVAVDMADGAVRWHREISKDPAGLAAVAGLILTGPEDRLMAYDDRTGALRWTAASMDMDLPQMQHAGGLLVVSSAFSGGPVTAYAPATGRLDWTFQTPAPQAGVTASLAAVAAGSAGVAVAAMNLPGPGRLSVLDLTTGRVRWQASALVSAGPLVTPGGVTDIEAAAANGPVMIVHRDAADGRIRWQDPLAQSFNATGQTIVPLVQVGQLVLAQGNASATLSAYWLDNGSPAWQVILPGGTQSPAPVPGKGVLVQPASTSGCAPVPG
jgi:outer membrane protein assembly factor BamB